jgi:hypothetical protein
MRGGSTWMHKPGREDCVQGLVNLFPVSPCTGRHSRGPIPLLALFSLHGPPLSWGR